MPLTASHRDLPVSDAYAVQLAQVAVWTAADAVVRGHKVGLTSAAMQRQLGVDQPDFHMRRRRVLATRSAGALDGTVVVSATWCAA